MNILPVIFLMVLSVTSIGISESLSKAEQPTPARIEALASGAFFLT